MIKALFVDQLTFSRCYAMDISEAIAIFTAHGLHGYCKEVGTDKWINY